ncbi:hypothetical protein PSP31121_04865 [Pandoraea sputorum]|uniref:Uncharacterized protein n=1 Tax=Pandoraea sputorum TaxID=93222 RepID=A0A5E5BI03_9BURK|nr:hypothetical protein PSP31121_04865 [Pandoraea sputorum]
MGARWACARCAPSSQSAFCHPRAIGRAARFPSRFGATRRPRASAQGAGDEWLGRGHRRALSGGGHARAAGRRIGRQQAWCGVVVGESFFAWPAAFARSGDARPQRLGRARRRQRQSRCRGSVGQGVKGRGGPAPNTGADTRGGPAPGGAWRGAAVAASAASAGAALPRATFLGEDRGQMLSARAGDTPLPENDPVLRDPGGSRGLRRVLGPLAVPRGTPGWGNARAPQRGEGGAHLGAGARHYTAILAARAGRVGRASSPSSTMRIGVAGLPRSGHPEILLTKPRFPGGTQGAPPRRRGIRLTRDRGNSRQKSTGGGGPSRRPAPGGSDGRRAVATRPAPSGPPRARA